jgi:hypothetical protein
VGGFLAYLRQHGAVASLLRDVEPLDLAAFTQLAFRTKRFFSPERWAVVGDAAAFADPFYSPGSDFIALENDCVADLVRRDLAGDPDFAEAVEKFDQYLQYRFDTTLVVYDGLYETFGSYELFRAKVYFDTAVYYALLFEPYVLERHRNLKWVRSELRRRAFGMELMERWRRLFQAAAAELKGAGRYHEHNAGHHSLDAFQTFGILTDLGAERTRRERNALTESIFQETQRRIAAALGADSPTARAVGEGSRVLYDAWSQLAAS